MNKQIRNKLIPMAAIMLVGMVGATLQSCSDDDSYDNIDYYRARGIVTVKQSASGATYFQLDNQTTLLPTNLQKPLYDGKEVRALANWKQSSAAHEGYTQAIEMLWADSIRTKNMMAATNIPDNLGDDPVEIGNSWATCLEDGYLTLCVCAYWGVPIRTHRVELVAGTNKDNPYELVLRHDACGDTGGSWNTSIVAFRLDQLPADVKAGQKITLRWKSFSGPKSTTFTYGAATSATSTSADEPITLHGMGTME